MSSSSGKQFVDVFFVWCFFLHLRKQYIYINARKTYNTKPTCTKSRRMLSKCNGTRTETRFRLSAKRTSPFKSAGVQFSRLLAAKVCTSAVVMRDTLFSEVLWRVLATHSIRQFPLHFPFRASPCALTFHLDSTINESLRFETCRK
jgi:hypothetical protein